MNEDVAKLKKENEQLSQELADYESLHEDLLAQRVFDKVFKLAKRYVALGTAFVALAGVLGLWYFVDSAKTAAEEKVRQFSEEYVVDIFEEKATAKISEIVEEQNTKLIETAQQQVMRITSAASPIAAQTPDSRSRTRTGKVDYSPELTPVRDQRHEGSVVGFAVAAALEYQISKTEGQSVVISPRFIYYYARKQGGFSTSGDSGARVQDAVTVLRNQGAVSEEAWPYRAGEFAQDPPDDVSSVRHYKIKDFQPVNTVEQLKSALASFGPVPGGVILYDTFYSAETDEPGKIELPQANAKPLGSHAVCFVGYDDNKKLFKFKNSWGTKWGDNGYGYLPYKYVERFLTEAYAISM